MTLSTYWLFCGGRPIAALATKPGLNVGEIHSEALRQFAANELEHDASIPNDAFAEMVRKPAVRLAIPGQQVFF